MKQWYPKEFSQLTHVSVRTLHHYDHIGLLKPSVRQSNGYRLYSETDLFRLQQIIALKFFGFELAKIQRLLTNETSLFDHLALQTQCLQEKAKALTEASSLLQRVMSRHQQEQFIPWEDIIQLIEVYRMTQQLENSWVKEIFNTDELKQFAKFEADLKINPTPRERFKKEWPDLIEEVKNNLHQDPQSPFGITIGERCMAMVNSYYGKENANLRTKIFEKGFGEGKYPDDSNLTPEVISWLEKAADAYWRQRIYGILAQVGKIPSAEVLALWNTVLDDMYGNEEERKTELLQVALADHQISEEAKKWLKGTLKSE